MPLLFPVAAQVKSLPDLGLYLHVPFCVKKCAYCDFYSAVTTEQMLDKFTKGLIKEIKRWGGIIDRPIDTLYIGGGTPSLLQHRIMDIIGAVRENFVLLPDSEITAELNPSGDITDFLQYAKKAGVNRLSIGVQSGIDGELKMLGRQHTVADAKNTVNTARELGFDNISLDLMLCLPDSTIDTLSESIDCVLSLEPEHVSAYMLKIEPNTIFGRKNPMLPDDEAQSQQYLYMCDRLENAGYSHYEISNFARNGYESRHNTKYWILEDYLGIGPSAHSCLNGRRFYYPKDLHGFIDNPKTVDDGAVEESERIMLGLRLKDGITIKNPSGRLSDFLSQLEKAKLIKINGDNLSLTNSGMLVSNSIITEITELAYENV